MTAREIILLSLGQAGVQIANATWDLFTKEHEVGTDGRPTANAPIGPDGKIADYSFRTFFQEMRGGRYVPRALLIDLEPSVVDEIRIGAYRRLYHPDQMITGIEDASGLYARGFYTVGRSMIDEVVNQLRRLVECCDCFNGFAITNCFGGGTGSGLTSLLVSMIGMEYVKSSCCQLGIFPGGPLSVSTLEPYNTILSIPMIAEMCSLCMIADNNSMFRICSQGMSIRRPGFTDCNRLIARLLSSLTSSVRFESKLPASVCDVDTNLVPFPGLHFPVCCMAPLEAKGSIDHNKLGTKEITFLLFEKENWLVDLRESKEPTMSAFLQFRGDDS